MSTVQSRKGLRPPQIFGIVNITSDSFSDGGRFLEPHAAIAHAQELVRDGADVVDVGAASSHPDASDVAAETEIARLEAVWDGLQELGAPISVDSFQPATQRWALARGADWLNDINGFCEPEMYDELADADAKLVVMHAIQAKGIATRAPPPEGDIWTHIFRFFEARLAQFDKAGIAHDRLVLDPGMGFFLGNKPETSLTVLTELTRLKAAFDLPVLVCVSRKSFLRKSAATTLEAETIAMEQGVDFIRTHDVRQLSRAMRGKK